MTSFDQFFKPGTIPKPRDQHDPKVRANQRAFQEKFGDFKSRHVTGFQVGPAPKGEWVGILFHIGDGSTVKVSVPYTLWQPFGNEFILAMMSAAELVETAYGKPGGKA